MVAMFLIELNQFCYPDRLTISPHIMGNGAVYCRRAASFAARPLTLNIKIVTHNVIYDFLYMLCCQSGMSDLEGPTCSQLLTGKLSSKPLRMLCCLMDNCKPDM